MDTNHQNDNESIDDSHLPSYMRATKSKKNYVKTEEKMPYERTMRSKSPVKAMFDKKGTFKIHDDNIPGGKFSLYHPKDRNFRTNHPLLDNMPEEEMPDENAYHSRSNSPSRPQRRQPRQPRNYEDDDDQPRSSHKKSQQYQERELNWDRKKGLKGKQQRDPMDEMDNDYQSKSPSKYQTNQSVRSIAKSHKSLARSMNQSMMRSNASIRSTATTVNQERLQYVKKCRKLRGYALLEALFFPLTKTVREGFTALENNCSFEKVNMFKNYGDEFFNEHWEGDVMHKTCAVVTEAVKNKKILDENQQTIHQKNLNIKDTETQIDEESEKLNKLDRFIDQSKQELPLQLKVMQFSYTMGNIIANRWAKRAEFNRCVAETYKSEAMDTVGSSEEKVVETIREKLKEGYKQEIETNYKMEKMKLHSQVRTAECKEKLMLQNMKKKRDELDVLKTSLAQVEDKIKAINENIYSREYKLEKLQEELRTTRDQYDAMQSIEDVENVIRQNKKTMRTLKSTIMDKSQAQNSLLNRKYALDSESKVLGNRLFEENKKLKETQKNVETLRLEQEVFTRRGAYEEKNKSNIAKQVKASLLMLKQSDESKRLRHEKYYNLLKMRWRWNLKARNSYKNLVTTLEKILDVRLYKDKTCAYTNLKLNYLKFEKKPNTGSDKLQNAQQIIATKEKELELQHVKSTSNSLNVVKDALLNNQEVFNRVFADENLFGELPEDQFFSRLNNVFTQAETAKKHLNSHQKVDEVINSVTSNQEIKQLINQQLEKTKVLKNKLDEVKEELFSDYNQEEEENEYPDILNHFTSMQKEYTVRVSKLAKEDATNIGLELDSRIAEIKRMRDGAEMDLDLDITQRMLENDEKDVHNMAEVVDVVDKSCNMLENENSMLAEELAYFEELLKLHQSTEKEEKKLNSEIASNESKYKELVKKVY